MATFAYKARKQDGSLVEGMLTAEHEGAALRMLDERSLFPVAVSEGGVAGQASLFGGGPKKIKAQRLAEMYGQLSDLLRAGVPVMRSLDVLSRQSSDAALAEILREVGTDVAGGETLADAMAKHPHAFNELHLAMIRAGEHGAFLEDVLYRIAIFSERQNELRNKLIGSMIYPSVLVVAGVGVLLALLLLVVPKVRPFLEGGDLPWMTTVLFALCDFLRGKVLAIVGVLVVGVVALVGYARGEVGADKIDRLKLRMPVLGNIITMVAICRFCRILGTLLRNGVPILGALKISKESVGNKVLGGAIEEATESVNRGDPLATPLGESGLFPPAIIDMIAVGEEANNLEDVLIHIADANEARTARMIDLAVRLVEPVLLIVMAVMVLIIALALLVPILTGGLSGMR